MNNVLFAALLVACSAPPPPPKAPKAPAEERFDFKVRGDFFDGLGGDTAALDRAMKVCDDTLAKNPKHAEALVWHGAGTMARARFAFQGGDSQKGMQLYTRGLDEMARAVALAPRSVAVRIPRGAVLLNMAPHLPEPERTKLLEAGLDDYEVTLAVQQPRFATLSLHAREQLLYGLTDGYANLGDGAKAKAFYDRMVVDAGDSELLARAKARAAGETPDGPAPCAQCHAR